MSAMLYTAALLVCAVSVAHSYLGEKYLLMRLFRRTEDLPKLLGSSEYTAKVLRFAWHLTSVAWLGLAGVLVALADPPASPRQLGLIVGGTFLFHFALALVASRGKHLSWPLFLAIGILAIVATRA